MKVLVVDDDDEAKQDVNDALRRLGNEPVVAPDSERALALLREFSLDALVVGVAMPALSGVDFVRTARQQKPNMRIVAVSGEQPAYPAAAALKAAQAVGADAILYRPFCDATLAKALRD